MPQVITPVSLKLLFTKVFNAFDEARQGGTRSDGLMSLALQVPSSNRYNTYAWLAGFPRFREWVGQRAVRGLTSRAFQIYNKYYEDTIGLDRDSFDNQNIADLTIASTLLAEAAAQLPFDLIIDLLLNGHTRVCYDGQFFFDTDHPTNLDSVTGTQSNYVSTGMALTRTNYSLARSMMKRFRGEDDRPFGARPNLLIVPPQLEDTANDIVLNDGGSPGGNPLRGSASVEVIPELDAAPTAWYLADTNGALKPFVLQTRQAPRIQSKINPNDDNVFWHKEYVFGADASYGAGYGAWWKIAKFVA